MTDFDRMYFSLLLKMLPVVLLLNIYHNDCRKQLATFLRYFQIVTIRVNKRKIFLWGLSINLNID